MPPHTVINDDLLDPFRRVGRGTGAADDQELISRVASAEVSNPFAI